MKKLLLLSLFSGLLFTSCQKCNDGCIDESRKNPNGICTKEYAPVCGCDGNTYGNKCEAGNAVVISYTEGACDKIVK